MSAKNAGIFAGLRGWFANRDQRRAIRARYDSASASTRNARHWSGADMLAPDAAASPHVRRTIVSRARYEFANGSVAHGILSTFAGDIVGTGPKLSLVSEVRADRATGRRDAVIAAAASEIESGFNAWQQAVHAPKVLRSMALAYPRDGEVFSVIRTNPSIRHPVMMDFAAFETDQFSLSGMVVNPVDDERDGIEIDELGNPTRYWMLREHPGSLRGSLSHGEGAWLKAADVIHLAYTPRPGQYRGIPMIAPSLPMFGYMRRFVLATLGAAEIAAGVGGVIHSMNPPVGDADDSAVPYDMIDLEPGAFMTLPEGWDIKQFKSEHPSAEFEMFRNAIISEIARCLDMPFNIAAANSSSYNYASGRLDHQTYYSRIAIERNIIEQTILERLFAAWAGEAVLITGYLSTAARQLLSRADGMLPPHTWRWPVKTHVDPAKEATAAKIRIETGTSSLAYECARSIGEDWEEVMEQRSREASRARELGLPVPGESEMNVNIDDREDK